MVQHLKPKCPTRRASDVRSMWLFGMEGEELRKAGQCNRVAGHRGPCLHRPHDPPPPWRRIRVYGSTDVFPYGIEGMGSPDDEGWVGAACVGCPDGRGGVFKDYVPVGDDGQPFHFLEGEWRCPTCAVEMLKRERVE